MRAHTDKPYPPQTDCGRHERFEEERRAAKTVLRTVPAADLTGLHCMPTGLSEREAREFVEENVEMYVDLPESAGRWLWHSGAEERREAEWYKTMNGFPSPVALRKRHPGFNAAWRQLKTTGEIDQATELRVCPGGPSLGRRNSNE